MKTQTLKFYGLMMILILTANTMKAENIIDERNDGNTSVVSVETHNNADAYTVKIFDSNGKMVFQESETQLNSNETQLLGNLTEGYYTYQVIHGNEMVYRAIISTNGVSGSSVENLPGNASASIAQKEQMVLVRLLKDNKSRARIEIKDMSDQTVYSKQTKKADCQRLTHDISDLPQGKYYLNVYSKGVLVAQKLIVK